MLHGEVFIPIHTPCGEDQAMTSTALEPGRNMPQFLPRFIVAGARLDRAVANWTVTARDATTSAS
jgi:hypothetical protein